MISPCGNLVLIGLCVESSGNHVPLALLDDIPLNLGHGSAVGTSVSGPFGARICQYGSPSQLPDRTYDGLAECIKWCTLQSTVKSLTHLAPCLSGRRDLLPY